MNATVWTAGWALLDEPNVKLNFLAHFFCQLLLHICCGPVPHKWGSAPFLKSQSINTLDGDVGPDEKLKGLCKNNASHAHGGCWARQWNDTKWTAVSLNWSQNIKHTACIELSGCVVSSRVHQKFASKKTAWGGRSPEGRHDWLNNYWADDHSLPFSTCLNFLGTAQ